MKYRWRCEQSKGRHAPLIPDPQWFCKWHHGTYCNFYVLILNHIVFSSANFVFPIKWKTAVFYPNTEIAQWFSPFCRVAISPLKWLCTCLKPLLQLRPCHSHHPTRLHLRNKILPPFQQGFKTILACSGKTFSNLHVILADRFTRFRGPKSFVPHNPPYAYRWKREMSMIFLLTWISCSLWHNPCWSIHLAQTD